MIALQYQDLGYVTGQESPLAALASLAGLEKLSQKQRVIVGRGWQPVVVDVSADVYLVIRGDNVEIWTGGEYTSCYTLPLAEIVPRLRGYDLATDWPRWLAEVWSEALNQPAACGCGHCMS